MKPGSWRYRRKRIGCIASTGLAQTVMVFDWLIGKYETFSLDNSWCLRNKVKLTRMWLTVNYARSVFCRCYCPSSGSLILGAQIVHIYEVKGKLALFSTKDNIFLAPHPSYSFTINLFSLLESWQLNLSTTTTFLCPYEGGRWGGFSCIQYLLQSSPIYNLKQRKLEHVYTKAACISDLLDGVITRPNSFPLHSPHGFATSLLRSRY